MKLFVLTEQDSRIKTRRNLVYGLSKSMVLACIWLATAASAQTSTITSPASGPNHAGQNPAIHSLRQAHKLLSEADHDYKGHRAKAAEDVRNAIRELEGKHHHKTSESGSDHAAGPDLVTGSSHVGAADTNQAAKIREPQAASDAQLSQALTILLGIQPELTSQNPMAATSVAAAISEVHAALSIK